MPPSLFFVSIPQFERDLSRNPSRPPFFKGRRGLGDAMVARKHLSPGIDDGGQDLRASEINPQDEWPLVAHGKFPSHSSPGFQQSEALWPFASPHPLNTRKFSALPFLGSHIPEQIHHPIRITPFVVVPGDDLECALLAWEIVPKGSDGIIDGRAG